MASYAHSGVRSLPVGRADSPTTGHVSIFLAAAIIVSIPLAPLATVSMPTGKLSVTWLMIFTLLALIDAAVTALMKPTVAPLNKSVFVAGTAAVLLMLPSALFTSEAGAGYLAYVNFVVGVGAGVRVGVVWASLRLHSVNVVDLAMFTFVATTVVQLLVRFAGAESVNALHQNAAVPWGNSNYVAGVLVVTGMLIIGRAQLLRRGRGVAYLVAIMGFVAAVMTLSRGGVTALAVGIAAALWMLPQKSLSKFFMRLCALTLPILAWVAIGVIQDQRAQVNSQVHENVDTRFRIWSLAWQAFLESPLVGSGWAHFRTISSVLEQQTFAHNLFLSYLQIGGLIFGLPLLVIMIAFGLKSISRYRPSTPGLIALFAIAQTDPFTEGSVGGMTLWMAVAFACTLPGWACADRPRPGRAGRRGDALSDDKVRVRLARERRFSSSGGRGAL